MRYLPLLFANLKRKRIRTTLTLGSFMVAMFLFGLLAAVRAGFRQGVTAASADRLVVVSDLAHAPVAPATGEDTGGAENHVRAAAVFLSGAHPVKKNEAHVGVTVDQL